MKAASSEGCDRNVTELHIIMLMELGTYSIEQSFVKASNPVFSASFVCVQLKTKRRPFFFFTAALIPTADAVEQCEPPALKFPACPRSLLKPLDPSFVPSAGAKPSVQLWFESVGDSWVSCTCTIKFYTTSQKFGHLMHFFILKTFYTADRDCRHQIAICMSLCSIGKHVK